MAVLKPWSKPDALSPILGGPLKTLAQNMSTPRSALKFDIFANSNRKDKLDEVGEPLQVKARHIDLGQLAALADALIERSDGRKGGRFGEHTGDDAGGLAKTWGGPQQLLGQSEIVAFKK